MKHTHHVNRGQDQGTYGENVEQRVRNVNMRACGRGKGYGICMHPRGRDTELA